MVLRTDDGHHWHFDKRLSLDTIVAIIGIAFVIGGPLIFTIRSMDTRILKLETVYEESVKADAMREKSATEQRLQLTTQIDRLTDRLSNLQVDVAKLVGAAGSTGGQIILQTPVPLGPTRSQPHLSGGTR